MRKRWREAGDEGENQPKSVPIVFPTGKTGRAYRAQEPLPCAGHGCGRTIGVGALYTRHKPQAASYHYSVHAFCRQCVPFEEAATSQEALAHAYEQTPWGQEDEQTWRERYGHRSILGPGIRMVEVTEE